MKHSELGKPEDYVLSEDRHERFRKEHAEDRLAFTSPTEKPTVVVLAGQPGAGKSALRDQALHRFEEKGGAVLVDIDELRGSHPAYPDLMDKNNRLAASYVQRDASRWGNELIEDASAARRNIVIDGTLSAPHLAEARCRDLKRLGYRVEIHAMAVRKEDSELDVYRRYEQAKANGVRGRWVPAEVRDDSYPGMRNSIDRLNRSESVDLIEIHGRSLDEGTATRRLHSGKPGDGNPVGVLDAERDRPRTPQEDAVFRTKCDQVATWIRDRDKKLVAEENKAFFKAFSKDSPAHLKEGPEVEPRPQRDTAAPEASKETWATAKPPAREDWSAPDKSARQQTGKTSFADIGKTGDLGHPRPPRKT